MKFTTAADAMRSHFSSERVDAGMRKTAERMARIAKMTPREAYEYGYERGQSLGRHQGLGGYGGGAWGHPEDDTWGPGDGDYDDVMAKKRKP